MILVIQGHIYLLDDISSRHTSPEGMNYFSMDGKQYRANAKTMFD